MRSMPVVVLAAVGTMANRFVEGEVAALDGQGSVLEVERTDEATVRARLLGTEGLGLLLQEGAEGALGQTGRGGRGDLLHRLEVDLRADARLSEGTTSDNFSPLGRHVTDFLELLTCTTAARGSRDKAISDFWIPCKCRAEGRLHSVPA